MRTLLILKLEATAGDEIEGVAEEMARISNLVGVAVEVEFNGVGLICTPRRLGWEIVAEYFARYPGWTE